MPSASVQTIVRLRYHEIFSLIQAQILKDVGADEPRIDRVVLSGGAAALCGIVELARYIDSKPVLRSEIAQLDIAPNGDIVLYTRRPGPSIIFGDSADYVTKFRKLEAWWRNIEPQLDEKKHYKTINLKYNQQIICSQL